MLKLKRIISNVRERVVEGKTLPMTAWTQPNNGIVSDVLVAELESIMLDNSK